MALILFPLALLVVSLCLRRRRRQRERENSYGISLTALRNSEQRSRVSEPNDLNDNNSFDDDFSEDDVYKRISIDFNDYEIPTVRYEDLGYL